MNGRRATRKNGIFDAMTAKKNKPSLGPKALIQRNLVMYAKSVRRNYPMQSESLDDGKTKTELPGVEQSQEATSSVDGMSAN